MWPRSKTCGVFSMSSVRCWLEKATPQSMAGSAAASCRMAAVEMPVSAILEARLTLRPSLSQRSAASITGFIPPSLMVFRLKPAAAPAA